MLNKILFFINKDKTPFILDGKKLLDKNLKEYFTFKRYDNEPDGCMFKYEEYDENNNLIFFENYQWNENKELEKLSIGFNKVLFEIELVTGHFYGLKSLQIENEYFELLKALEEKAHLPLCQDLMFLKNIAIHNYGFSLKGSGITDEVIPYITNGIKRIRHNSNPWLSLQFTSLSGDAYRDLVSLCWSTRVDIKVVNITDELKISLVDLHKYFYATHNEGYMELIIDNEFYIGENPCPSYETKTKKFSFCLGSRTNNLKEIDYFIKHYASEVKEIELTYYGDSLNDGIYDDLLQGYDFGKLVKRFYNISFPKVENLYIGESYNDYISEYSMQDIGDLSLLLKNTPKLKSISLIGCDFTLTQNIEFEEKPRLSYEIKDCWDSDVKELIELPKETLYFISNIFDNHLFLYDLKYNPQNLKEELILMFNGYSFKNIPEEIYSLINLEELDLADNKIKSVSSKIENLVNLKDLDLSFNELESLPDEICKLKKLEYLSLYSNENLRLSLKQKEWIKELMEVNECDVSLPKGYAL